MQLKDLLRTYLLFRRSLLPIAFFLFATTGASPAPLDTFRDCDVCPEMIELPLGSFIMGSPPGESPLPTFRREQPMHRVEIDILIFMGRNDVTFEEWKACWEYRFCCSDILDNSFFRAAEMRKSWSGQPYQSENFSILAMFKRSSSAS